MYTSRTKARVIAPMNALQQVGSGEVRPSPTFDKQWTLARFFFSWLACCLTPVCIGIVQAFEYSNPLVQLSIACDAFFVVETLHMSGHLTSIGALFRRQMAFVNQHMSGTHNASGGKSVHIGKGVPPTHHRIAFSPPSPFSGNKAIPNGGNYRNKRLSQGSLVPILRALMPLLLPIVAQLCGASDLLQAWLTLPRLVRLHDLVKIYHTLKDKFTDFAALHNDTINRCFMTAVFTSIYSSSLAACWFYLSCRRQQQCSSEEDSDSWVGRDDVLREQDMFSIYIRSLHFIIQTLFTVGYGDINIVTNKEYVFSLFLILNGSLYYAFLISAITSLLSNKDVTTKMFRADVASLHKLLQLRDVPEALRLRIDQLMQFSLAQQCGCSENVFLHDIPKPLLREIKCTYIAQLQQLPFFSGLSSRFMELCVERLVYRTYVPGSVVYFQNERRREVILIKTGKIELKVHSAQGALFTCMAGDSIGDFQLIFGNPSEVTAQASTFTEVMVLSLEAFTAAVQAYNLGSSISVDQWLADQSSSLQATIDSHRKHLVKFVKTRMTIEVTRKNKRMLDMMADIHTVRVACIILPDDRFRPLWAAASLLGMTYFIFAIPMRVLAYLQCAEASMHVCLSSWDYSLVVDYLWDVFFIIDLVLHSFFFAFKSFENDQHMVVTNRREIFRRFWKSPIACIHVLAVLPIDLLSLRWGYLLCLRLSKLLWVSLFFDKIALILYYYEHDSAKKQALLSTEGITVIHLTIITFLVMLWTAVGWSMLRLETDGPGFVASLYWTMTTMTTVGFGDITPDTNLETLFTVIFCIIGPSCCATIIANAASFFNSTDVSVDNVSHRQLVVKTFLSTVIPEFEQPGRRKSSLLRMEKKVSITAMSASCNGKGRRRSSDISSGRVHPVESSLDVVNENHSPASVLPFSTGRRNSGLPPGHFTRRRNSSGSSNEGMLSGLRRQSDECSAATKHAHVVAYLEYVARERRGLDEKKLLQMLMPDYMRESLQQARVMEVVLSSNFYSKCNSGFLRDVMLAMEVRFVPQNAVILNAGSAVSGSYMILSGIIQIFTAQGRRNQKLSAGESFGEVYLFEEGSSNFRAEAHTDCEILIVRRVHFQQILRGHGTSAMQVATEHMIDVAKLSSKRIVNTPMPSIRCLLAGQEQKRVASKGSSFVDPKSLQYHCWVSLLTALTLCNVILLPARLAFMENLWDFWSQFVIFDYLCDLCYVIDIVLRRRYLVFYERQGPVYSREYIRAHYAEEGHFYLHALAAMPLDFILIGVGAPMVFPGLSLQQAIAVFRLNKLLRCVDLPSHSALVEERLAKYFSSTLKLIIRVCKLIFTVVILAHIFGCIFFIVGNQQHLRGGSNNWADDAGILRSCSLGSMGAQERYECGSPTMQHLMNQYVFSIYWATATLTTVGFGDISAVSGIEQTFAMLVFLVGTAAYTVIVTNLEDIVSHMDVTSDLFKNRQARIQNFLRRERVPDVYFRKSLQYQEKLWTMQKGAQGHEVKAFLPPNVYSDIVTATVKAKMKLIFFLKHQSSEFIADLSSHMLLQTYLSFDTIFHTGEAANQLYVMSSGEVAMISEATGQQYAKVYAGESARIGSTEFFRREVYHCTAQAASDVIMFEVDFNSFWEVVELHRLEHTFALLEDAEESSLRGASTYNLVSKFSANLNKNSKMSMMMKQASRRGLDYFDDDTCILPDSWFYHWWSISSIVLICYIALTVPYCIAFRCGNLGVAVCDALLFVFFAVDMFLRLRYFAVMEDGELIKDRNQFSGIYIDVFLKGDLFSTLPIALIVLGISRSNALFAVARALYLARLPRLNAHFHDLLTLLSAMTSNRLSLAPDKLRVGKVLASVCYLAHVTCCVMCMIGLSEQARGGENWIDANEFTDLSPMSIYLRAYFWAIYTIVTVGFGSLAIVTNAEKIFSMSVMIVGAIMCDAGITAMLSSIIANADKLSGVTRRSKESMMQFCRSHHYSEDIQTKVAQYYDYLSSDLQNSVEAQDFGLLPSPLQQEFARMHVFDALCSLCLLDTENEHVRLGFVYSLLRHVELTVAIPGQVILPVGGLDIHILRRGRAYARMAGLDIPTSLSNGEEGRRDYFQEGEALCREGRLNTTAAMSPGKLVSVTLRSLESIHITSGAVARRGSVAYNCNVNRNDNGKSAFSNSLSGGTDKKEGRRSSFKKFLSARRGSITRRGSGLEKYLGVNSSLSAIQPSSVHARLSCGARKMATATKTFSSGGTSNVVQWDEDFTFHVPKTAASLKVVFFDDKQVEDNGRLGEINIKFAELEDMPVRKTVVKDDDSSDSDSTSDSDSDSPDESAVGYRTGMARALIRMFSSEGIGVGSTNKAGNERAPPLSKLENTDPPPPPICTVMADDTKQDPDEQSSYEGEGGGGGGGEMFAKELEMSSPSRLPNNTRDSPVKSPVVTLKDSATGDATSVAVPPSATDSTPSPSREVYMYYLKQDVRDKHGKLQGIANLQITIRGAGVAEFPHRKRAMAFAHSKQLSRTPTEVVAESFCHLFTVPTEKLTELRTFYGDFLTSENAHLPNLDDSHPVSSSRERTASVTRRSRSSTKFTTASSVRNFKSSYFASSKSVLSALSTEDNTAGPQSRQQQVQNGEKSESAHRQRRTSNAYVTASTLSNNQQLRRMSCAAIASASQHSSSSDATSSAASTMTPAQLFRRHSAIKRAERVAEQGADSESEGERTQSSLQTGNEVSVKAHARKMRRISLVLQGPAGDGVTRSHSQQSNSPNVGQVGSSSTLGSKCGDTNTAGGAINRSDSSFSCSSIGDSAVGSVVSVSAMQQELSSGDEDDDDFDSEISDDEMEEAFGLAALAKNLRKDSSLERCGFRLSWS